MIGKPWEKPLPGADYQLGQDGSCLGEDSRLALDACLRSAGICKAKKYPGQGIQYQFSVSGRATHICCVRECKWGWWGCEKRRHFLLSEGGMFTTKASWLGLLRAAPAWPQDCGLLAGG